MILRILFYALVVLALAWGFSWLADRPGELSLVWQGQLIKMSLMVAATLLVALIAIVMFVWWLVRTLWTSPQSLTRYFRARKRDRGYQALSTGLIAAGAGNAALARKMNSRAKDLLRADQEPLIHLLEAQACLIEGRYDEARAKFEAMSNDPETRELGLRGLYLEAKRLGADEAARQYAEKAAEKAPHLSWAADATIEHLAKHGLFDDAIRLLEQSRLAGAVDKKTADRKKAVLLTARAAAKLEADSKGARDDAQMALRLDETLIPASLTAAKALFRENNLRRGAAILETAWKNQTHPDIAKVYVRARSGDSAVDRLKRAERLESLTPNNVEGVSALARALLDAKDFAGARAKAEAAARMNPCQSAFLLMADIEEADTGDQGRIRHWLSMARNAPHDAAWVADGYVSDTWLPVSPVTGELDAFEWKVPVTSLSGPVVDGSVATVDDAFLSLPPVAPKPVEIVVAAPPPQMTVQPVADIAPVAATATQTSVKPAEQKPEPFFGHAPDDPGVRQGSVAVVEKKSRLRLF